MRVCVCVCVCVCIFPGDSVIKNPPAKQEMWVWSLGGEEPLEKDMATHSSILAWEIPGAEEPGGLQSMGLQRVGHEWATNSFTHTHTHTHTHVSIYVCVQERERGRESERDLIEVFSKNPLMDRDNFTYILKPFLHHYPTFLLLLRK